MTSTQPAQIILQQLGGRVFIAMTGSRNFFHSDNGNTLTMHLARNKAQAKFLKITLEANDTYTVRFSKLTGKKFAQVDTVVKEYKGVYCDMLQDIFTTVTGLYTKL